MEQDEIWANWIVYGGEMPDLLEGVPKVPMPITKEEI